MAVADRPGVEAFSFLHPVIGDPPLTMGFSPGADV
jgi:hypothetical protein